MYHSSFATFAMCAAAAVDRYNPRATAMLRLLTSYERLCLSAGSQLDGTIFRLQLPRSASMSWSGLPALACCGHQQ